MADAQASFALGEWDDAVPPVAGGEAPPGKVIPSWCRSRSRTGPSSRPQGRPSRRTRAGRRLPRSLEGEQPSYNVVVLAFAPAGCAQPRGPGRPLRPIAVGAGGATRPGNRFYHRSLAPHLVRLALALGRGDVAPEVADSVTASVAPPPEVPTLRSLALRCRVLVTGEMEPLIEAVDTRPPAPLVVEHAGACEDAASGLARAAGGTRRGRCSPKR